MRLSSEERGSHHQAIRNLHQKFKKIKRTWKHLTVDQDQYPLQLLESGRVLQNFKRQTQTRLFSKGEEKNLHFLALFFLPSYRLHCTVKISPKIHQTFFLKVVWIFGRQGKMEWGGKIFCPYVFRRPQSFSEDTANPARFCLEIITTICTC